MPRRVSGRRPRSLLATTFCIDSSGLTHGPPLPFQPASLFMFTSRPSRPASATTCLNSSRHLVAHEADRSDGRPLIDFHDEHAADAHAPHRLQVGGDAFARDVAVEPEPIDPRSGRVGRLEETLHKRIGVLRCGSLGRPSRTRGQDQETRRNCSPRSIWHVRSHGFAPLAGQ